MTNPPSSSDSAASVAPLPRLGVVAARWIPAATAPDATGHMGQAIAPDWVFPVAPPETIGPIRSAATTIQTDATAWARTWPRVWGGLSGFVTGAVFGNILCAVTLGTRSSGAAYGIGVLTVAILGAIIGLIRSAPKMRCDFVGVDGIASFVLDKTTHTVKKEEVFLFSSATDLRVSMTRNYMNAIYTGTDYAYKWRDDQGKPVFALAGRFYKSNGRPAADNAVWFARAAEAAWTQDQFERCQRRLAQGDTIVFSLGNKAKDSVRIAPGELILIQGDKVTQMDRDDVGTIRVDQGQVTVARKDAKAGVLGIGRQGIFQFPYANLGNARLFFALLGQAFAAPEDEAGGLSTAPVIAAAQLAGRAQRQANALKQAKDADPPR